MLKVIAQNLPALIISLPLLFAPIIAIISPKTENARYIAWLISFFITGLTAANAAYQLAEVEVYGASSYEFGNWSAEVGIEHLANHLNSMLMFFVAMLSFITMPYALSSIAKEVEPQKQPIFYACLMMCLSAMLGMLSTHDLFNFFVFLEIASITAYAMVSQGKSSAKATFDYLIIGAVAGTFYLLGVMLLYAQTGSLNFGDISQIIANQPANKVIIASACFIVCGLLIKAGAFPLAAWLPSAYSLAPSYVSGFLAGTSTKIALFALIKILFTLYPAAVVFEQMQLHNILLVVGVVAIFYGSLAAIYEADVKRMLAFSSIANIGYILLAIGLLNKDGLTSAIFNLVGHGVAKAGAFLVVGIFFAKTGSTKLADYAGLAKHMPFTTFLFLVFALSLAGAPLTMGFISKWYLLTSSTAHLFVFALVVASSLLSFVYVWRVVEVLYLNESTRKHHDPDSYYLAPLWALAAVIIYLGLNPSGLLRLASSVAGDLLK